MCGTRETTVAVGGRAARSSYVLHYSNEPRAAGVFSKMQFAADQAALAWNFRWQWPQ